MAGTRRFTALNGTALIVGLLAGIAAVLFRQAIDFVQALAFNGELIRPTGLGESQFITSIWGAWVILVPTAGGALIALLRWRFPDIRRQGIPEVMAAVQIRGGLLRARSAWGHAAVSAITVGTGGSTGREGPIGYIGAALGSSIGRRFGFRTRDIKVLLGAGVAAGIAATFNAPLGGVLFSMELILPEFSTHAFIPVVIAVVVGVTVGHYFLGDEPAFSIPEFQLQSPWELAFYMVLGLLCGLGGVGFIRLLGWSQDRAERIRLPDWSKPILGGLAVGLLGYTVFVLTGAYRIFGGTPHYHIFGTGYATVNGILQSEEFLILAPALLLLIVVKPIASSLTLASGGGGGVFSTSLYQGALYGALVGLAANHLFPALTAPAAMYALVGMGAFYASSGRATLTTIVLLMELTDSFTIVLPIMFAAVTADAVSVALSKDSIYTARLTKKGILYEHDRVQSPLDYLQVKDIMTRDVDTIPVTATVGEAFNKMIDLGHTGYPVVEENGQLAGVVTRRDLSKHMHEGRGAERLGGIVSGLLITTFPDELLHRARDRLFEQDIGRLLVVDPNARKTLLGIITRSDVLRAEAERDVEFTDSWKR